MADDDENHNLLIQSGMLTENNDQDSAYDRFRDRVMFPIRDIRGRTIAFGGRVMGDDKPKYLNSPETLLYFTRVGNFTVCMKPADAPVTLNRLSL